MDEASVRECRCGCGETVTNPDRRTVWVSPDHRKRWARRQRNKQAKPGQRACQVDGCGRVHMAKGYCANHYKQVRERLGLEQRNDPRISFTADRYCGDRISDWDLGAYFKALRSDPCVYCGDACDELDHITSKADGGENLWTNLAPVCSACNCDKGPRGPLQYLLARPLIAQHRETKAQLDPLGGLKCKGR